MKLAGWIFSLLTTIIILFSLPVYGMQLCDYHPDDDVDGQDLSEFSGYFAVQDPAADLNDSGGVDGQDLSICAQEFDQLSVEDIKPTVQVANLREKSVVKTDFIIGTANDNDKLISVEIKLDAGTALPSSILPNHNLPFQYVRHLAAGPRPIDERIDQGGGEYD